MNNTLVRNDVTFIKRLECIKEKHLRLSYQTTWSFSKKSISETRLYIKLCKEIDKLKENLRLEACQYMIRNSYYWRY